MNGGFVQQPRREFIGTLAAADAAEPGRHRGKPSVRTQLDTADPPRLDRARSKPPFTWRNTEPRNAEARAATYAIFASGRLMYIGSAVDLRKRLNAHGFTTRSPLRQTRFGPLNATTIRVAYNRRRFDHATRELRLIARLQPPLNANATTKRGRRRVVLLNASPERFRRFIDR